MSRSTPIAVRLPMAFARGRLSMAQVLTSAVCGDVRPRSAGSLGVQHADLRAFELRRREVRFVRCLLDAHPRFWIWRTDQRQRAGDFALVDMSSPDPARRRLWIVDLKLGTEPKLGGGGAGNQLTNHGQAVAELASAGVVVRVQPRLAVGDGLRLIDLVAGNNPGLRA